MKRPAGIMSNTAYGKAALALNWRPEIRGKKSKNRLLVFFVVFPHIVSLFLALENIRVAVSKIHLRFSNALL